MIAAPTTLADALLRPLRDSGRQLRQLLELTDLRGRATLRWSTRNEVLLEHPAMQLREFFADAEADAAGGPGLPLLLVAPEVNGSSIADFAPDQSFVRGALAAGFPRVAVVHWRSATEAIKHHRVEDSIGAIHAAVQALGGRVHLAGICQGGWEAAMVAATRPDAVASLTLIGGAVDFHAGDAALRDIVQALPQSAYEGMVALGGGVMRGAFLNQGFTLLQAFDRLVVARLRTWNQMDDPAHVERLEAFHAWYDTQKDLPGPMYLRVVDELFRQNLLIQGLFLLDGEPVRLERITCPVAMVAGLKDHITPPEQCFALDDASGSQTTRRWALDAGHVGVTMGREALRDHWPEIFAWLRAVADPGSAAPRPSVAPHQSG